MATLAPVPKEMSRDATGEDGNEDNGDPADEASLDPEEKAKAAAEKLAKEVEKRQQLEDKVQEGIEETEARIRELITTKAQLLREKRELDGKSKYSVENNKKKMANKQQIASVDEQKEKLETKLDGLEAKLDSDFLTTPLYMLSRKRLYHEAERELQLEEGLPYQRIPIITGQGSSERKVGTLKMFVTVIEENAEEGLSGHLTEQHEQLCEHITIYNQYTVRLYILRALNLLGTDPAGDVDGYLRVRVGDRTILNTRDRYFKDCFNTVPFFETVETTITLPGNALISVDVYDRDFMPTSDDLVGSTSIDLEDRIYSPMYNDQDVGAGGPRPPLEWRALYKPEYRTPTGTLEMWCEILKPEKAEDSPMLPIKPPEAQEWELRVIVWKLQDVSDNLKGMDAGGMGDFQVKVRLGGDERLTDTHWRAKNGKASWNWRFKFPVSLTEGMKYQRLTLQLWDRDILTADYMIGDSTLSLDTWFRHAFKKRTKDPAYWDGDRDPQLTHADEDKPGLTEMLRNMVEAIISRDKAANPAEVDPIVEHAKLWVPLETPEAEFAGKLLVSVQLMPKNKVDKLEAGEGREEPNKNPELPKPVGRLFFTLNPFSICYQFLGPQNCRALQRCLLKIFCALLCAMLLYSLTPVVMGNLITDVITG